MFGSEVVRRAVNESAESMTLEPGTSEFQTPRSTSVIG